MYKTKYFKIAELVNPDLLKAYGEAKCWFVLDERMLRFLDFLREKYGAITINGNGLIDCGWRKPDSATGASLSAHKFGRAFDCHIVAIDKANPDKKSRGNAYAKIRKELLADKNWQFVNFEMSVAGEPITWLHCDSFNRDSREFNG